MYKIQKCKFDKPSLEECAKVLQEKLLDTFSYVNVQVVESPDFREKPYMLSAPGICGNPSLADVGGVEYLLPLAQKDKIYNFRDILKKMHMKDALILGAGAGPRPHVGTNCEMMANLKLGKNEAINTHIAKLDENDGCELVHLKKCCDFCILGNLYISEGKPGKVIKVEAKKRIGSENFISAIRLALLSHFKYHPIGVGGFFLIRKGKAKLHIMPDYSEAPLTCSDDVDNWLKFFDTPAPLVCLSTFVTQDPGLNLRIEHTHCFSDHGVGGHYHYDTTPDEVEYEGYFNVVEHLYRVDQPANQHDFGRD